jgi:hypothetical protein
MKIANLDATEIEDFETELRNHKRSIDEFQISATPKQLIAKDGRISPLHGTVTVQHRNGTQRVYDTGHGTAWVARFTDDLKAGIF